MKREKRWVYYCEFCCKSGRSASSMAVHETHCTKNPYRKCRVCIHCDGSEPLAELVRIVDDACGKRPAEAEAVKTLMKASGGCPACALSAIRQSTKLEHLRREMFSTTGEFQAFTSFNYASEMKSVWAAVNENRLESEYHYGFAGCGSE